MTHRSSSGVPFRLQGSALWRLRDTGALKATVLTSRIRYNLEVCDQLRLFAIDWTATLKSSHQIALISNRVALVTDTSKIVAKMWGEQCHRAWRPWFVAHDLAEGGAPLSRYGDHCETHVRYHASGLPSDFL
ncbi:hypothetical protein RTCIAT899_PC03045 (plasmid) [Rhizobium tropici CIAT 899]|nr:hypothetical protein RTCIAT899_PC03045 [Rhizobium tropici CIAT 899]